LYLLSATLGYQLSQHTTLTATVTGTSSREVGFARVSPTAAVRMSYDLGPKTQFSYDVGTRIIQRHGAAQSYGDIGINQWLHKNLAFAVGLGTTFNIVSNAKAHYLASGFNLKLK
jgi:hypothetical protein